MTKKIFLILFFFPLLAEAQDVDVQDNNEEKMNNTNQVSFGLNVNPLFHINTPKGYLRSSYHLGYKRKFKTKYFFRTGINLMYAEISSTSSALRGSINAGIERNEMFGKK